MNIKTNPLLIYISVLSVFACSNCMGAIDGALSKIGEALQVNHTVALYAGSIAALASMFSSLILGMIVGKKVPYKAAAVFCAILVIVGGTAPFMATNFTTLLITRCFFGFGIGGLMCVQNPIATKLIPVEKRASILGIGTCVSFGFQCVLQLVGGVLADVRWNYVFFTHLILLLPLIVMIIFLPKMEIDQMESKQEKEGKLPITVILMCVVMGLVGLNLAPLLFGSAFYVAAIIDSATVAAVIAMLYSIGSMVGGLLYAKLYGILKRRSFTAFFIVGALGLFIGATADNIILLAIGFFIGGISNACILAGMMMLFGLICNPSQLGFASALMMAFMNLGAFLCSSWESLIGMITGDALYAPLYVGTVIFLLLALILFLKPPFPKAKE